MAFAADDVRALTSDVGDAEEACVRPGFFAAGSAGALATSDYDTDNSDVMAANDDGY